MTIIPNAETQSDSVFSKTSMLPQTQSDSIFSKTSTEINVTLGEHHQHYQSGNEQLVKIEKIVEVVFRNVSISQITIHLYFQCKGSILLYFVIKRTGMFIKNDLMPDFILPSMCILKQKILIHITELQRKNIQFKFIRPNEVNLHIFICNNGLF